jgi:predicted amidohydrolase YtcJ
MVKQLLKFTLFLISICAFQGINAQIADRVLKNAKVYVGSNTFTQAIAIKNERIIFTGTDAAVAVHIGAGTIVNDLGGKLVLPGIHDVHMHPLEASSAAGGTCTLSDTETNPSNLVTALQACGLTANSNGWLMAAGYAISTILTASDPKGLLDGISTTVPILVMEKTSHSIWVNSKALQMAGITAASVDPPGGHIVKNAMTGEPTGILLDNAGDNLIQIALAQNPTINAANYNGLVNYGLPLMAKNGITSISEARTYWKRNYIPIWQQIKTNNKLTVRVALAPWMYPSDDDATQIAAIQALYSVGDDMLKIRQIKVYSDGIIVNATSALSLPYNNNLGFTFGNVGLNYFTQSRLATYITALESTGYDFHIHAIGDRGITESLNAIEIARNTSGHAALGARHRITHVEMVNPTDYPRFAALNVVADMQVAGSFSQPSHWNDHSNLIGTRGTPSIPLKSLFNAGAKITLSSDWDVSNLNPFIGMQNALTRSPQEMPSVEEVVKSYTINGAYVMRQEAVTGSLEVNKYADLIVVDKDIFTIPTNQISTTKVLLTLLGGKQVYIDAVLPVNLVSFKGQLNDNKTHLEWVTSTEHHNNYFDIERSVDGVKFENIGTIKGNNTRLTSSYTYSDDNLPTANVLYYRLKQVNFDGTYEYSDIIALNKKTKTPSVKVSPNPAFSYIQLSGISDNTQVEIYNEIGQIVKKINSLNADNQISISDLSEGLYFIRLMNKDQSEGIKSVKFIKK